MTPDERIQLWHEFNRFQKSREKYYAPKINKALKAQVQHFIDGKSHGLTDVQAISEISSLPLYEVLKPLYIDAAINFGRRHLIYLKREKARTPIGFNKLITDLM